MPHYSVIAHQTATSGLLMRRLQELIVDQHSTLPPGENEGSNDHARRRLG